mgnify:CR=1 FL=1
MSGVLDITNPNQADSGADVVTGNITILNSNLATGTPTASSFVAINAADASTIGFQVTGTWTGTLILQGSLDNANWVTIANFTNINTGALASATTANGLFQADVSSLSYVRATASAAMTGTAVVTLSPSDNVASISVDNNGISINSLTPGTAAGNLGKAEDAVAASGDTGVQMLGVRIPTTPVSPTSAAGDYGAFAIDLEGKQVQAPYAGMEVSWQANPVTLTTTGSTALKASAGGALRNFITDITIANTSATGTRVDILDNATVIRSFWAAPTSNVTQSFSMPLKGTAATAVNVQLGTAVTDVRVSANGYLGI